ncbi:isocitrate lyase/PEP mutase family protein [Parasphingorhabdus sp.]|uniref:isocitrate lyase/PEP mutase family protein n=1 Tax=Parasphingorhabdus sp. TaxID=2709688 RepID=UPI003265469E
MSGTDLRAKLAGDNIIAAPGIYDHMSLLMANEMSFDAHYASGYWGTASAMGEPDVGVAGYSDFLRIFSGFAAKSKAPIIADADTGFGSLANLAHAVKGYQTAGIAAMQIEDQGFPKICGHVGQAVSVEAEEMIRRMHVAVEARGEGDILIIARSDARRTEGLDSAITRLNAYADNGADILFLEAPKNLDEIREAASRVSKPLLVNAAHGGFTPILAPADYQALGAKLVIYPAGAPLAAAQAAKNFYANLKSGDANGDGVGHFDFGDMSRLLGIDDVVALQKRHGGA